MLPRRASTSIPASCAPAIGWRPSPVGIPETVDEVAALPELRRWQVEVLGADFVAALAKHRSGRAPASASPAKSRLPFERRITVPGRLASRPTARANELGN